MTTSEVLQNCRTLLGPSRRRQRGVSFHQKWLRAADDLRELNQLPVCLETMVVLSALLFRSVVNGGGGVDWCNLDTGYSTITDTNGYPHNVYISVTRDGSVWLRAGRDHASLDWVYEDEYRSRFQTIILDDDVIHILQSINYTDYCVLSDVDMRITVDSGWHPSHLDVFDPMSKQQRIVMFRRPRDCAQISTNLTLSADKQGIVCNGGRRSACGWRHLPEAGQPTTTTFIKKVNFDPQGDDHLRCFTDQVAGSSSDELSTKTMLLSSAALHDVNRYTFVGSYYNVYVKISSCPPPKASRIWGHEAKLRPKQDSESNLIIIPDPTQTALSDGVVRGWQAYAKIVSVEHSVYFQIWRPSRRRSTSAASQQIYRYHGDSTTTSSSSSPDSIGDYTLVGQFYFRPQQLRFQEFATFANETIRFRRGDVLGLQFDRKNPVTWSSVPCAHAGQRYLRAELPVSSSTVNSVVTDNRIHHEHVTVKLIPGQTLKFASATSDEKQPCRHYSFTAILANRAGAKAIEDWLCPTAKLSFSKRRLETGSDINTRVLVKSDVRNVDELVSDEAANVERSQNKSLKSNAGHVTNTDDVKATPYVLVTVGCLTLMLITVGSFSYCTALCS